MSKKLPIILAATLGFGIGLYLCRKCKHTHSECHCESESEQPIAKMLRESILPTALPRRKALQKATEMPSSPQVVKTKTNRKPIPISADLGKYGTKQGVIDVGQKLNRQKKNKQLEAGLSRQASNIESQFLAAKEQEFKHQRLEINHRNDLINALEKDLSTTQLTISNTGDSTRAVELWNRKDNGAISPPQPIDVQDHSLNASLFIEKAVHPQGMAYNPANGYTYIANQLSDNVSVLDSDGQLIKLISLDENSHPGIVSPVDLTVNTNANSPDYGSVFVIGSVSNSLIILDRNLSLSDKLSTGCRPTSVIFNPVNDQIYVSSFLDNEVFAYDLSLPTIKRISVGRFPRGLGLNTHNGDVYVTNSKDNTVSIIDSQNNVKATLASMGETPITIAHHPESNAMYISHTDSGEVSILSSNDYTLLTKLPFTSTTYGMVYSPANQMIYMIQADSKALVTVNAQHQILPTPTELDFEKDSLTIDTKRFRVNTSTQADQIINMIGLKDSTGDIMIDEDYQLKVEEFQNHPIKFSSVKFYFQDQIPFRSLNLKEQSMTGKLVSEQISFADNLSPLNNQNMVTVPQMKGKILDGHQSWCFMLTAKTSVTMILQYTQIDNYYLIPEEKVQIN